MTYPMHSPKCGKKNGTITNTFTPPHTHCPTPATITTHTYTTRYHEIFFMIDTCQAASMYKQFSKEKTPNIIAAASSRTGQNSYSHHTDTELGVAVIDRFTFYNLETLERLKRGDQASMRQLVGDSVSIAR